MKLPFVSKLCRREEHQASLVKDEKRCFEEARQKYCEIIGVPQCSQRIYRLTLEIEQGIVDRQHILTESVCSWHTYIARESGYSLSPAFQFTKAVR